MPVHYEEVGSGGGGSGDVVGPGSSTDNAVVRFDGTTGKLIQNSGVIIDDSNNTTNPGMMAIGPNASTGVVAGITKYVDSAWTITDFTAQTPLVS